MPAKLIPDTTQEQGCSICGSKRFVLNVSMSATGEGGGVGLDHRTVFVFTGCESLLADLCLDCGTVHRFHVSNTDRKWIQK